MAENDVSDDVIDRLSTGSGDSDTEPVDADAFEAAEFDQVDNPPDIVYEQAKQTRLNAAKQYKQTALGGMHRHHGHHGGNSSGIARATSPSFLTKRKMRSELKQAEKDLNKTFIGTDEEDGDSNQVLFEDTLPVKGTVPAVKSAKLLAIQLPEIKTSKSMDNLPAISGSGRILPSVHKRASTDPSQRSPIYGASIELSKSVENLHMGVQSPRPPSAGRPRSGMGRRGLAPIVPSAKHAISAANNKLYTSGTAEKLYSPRK